MTEENARSPLLTQWRLIAIVFGVLSLGLGGWYYFSVRDSYTLLYAGLPAADASAIASDLGHRGIAFQTANNGRDILVPASQMERARDASSSAGSAPHAIEGFELFDQSDMGLNEFAERIRYQRAIQGELERTIMMQDGVVSARVHISIPDRTPFRGEQQPARAAVTISTRTPQDMNAARVEGIQRLIAASVADLTASDVVILNARGEVLSPRVEIADVSNALLGGDGQTRRTAVDLVTQIMRSAIPGRQFEVRIEQAATPGVGASDSGATPVFTRIIRIATPLALSDLEKERVRAALHRAGLVDGSLEQAVLFSVGLSADMSAPGVLSLPAQAPPRTATAAAPAMQTTASPIWLWPVGALIIMLVAAALWSGRKSRTRLSPGEHQQFAERLRQALSHQQAGPA